MDPIRCIGWQLITTMYMANYDTTTALETPHWYCLATGHLVLGTRLCYYTSYYYSVVVLRIDWVVRRTAT